MSGLLDDVLLLRGEESASRDTLASIDLATYEMQETYKEREPYTTSRLITGTEYIFGELFIEKVRYAMSTDNLDLMNNSELEVWNAFVQYSDEFSHSADEVTYPDAIGCTTPNEQGISYVVTSQGVTANECTIGTSELLSVDLASALDSTLMKILNCEDWIPVNVGLTELENVSSTCSL